MLHRCKVGNLERFKVVGLLDELIQRPVLQLVHVAEVLNSKVLKALIYVDSATEHVKHRVYHFQRRAGKALVVVIFADDDISYGL